MKKNLRTKKSASKHGRNLKKAETKIKMNKTSDTYFTRYMTLSSQTNVNAEDN